MTKQRQNKEQILASNVAKFMKMKYPSVIYRFDAAADLKMSIYQASRIKSLHGKFSKGYPDLFIAKPNKYYHGLFLELKADNASPFKKDGQLKKNEHLETQAKMHDHLRNEGYEVKFTVGLKDTIEIIEDYMENI
jgi:hypothetical protein